MALFQEENFPDNNETKPEASQVKCARCGEVVNKADTAQLDNGEILCADCFMLWTRMIVASEATKRKRESPASLSNYLLAFILGGIAAVVGGYIWSGITLALDAKWGIIALLIGAMVGFAVHFGGGRKEGMLTFGLIGALAAGAGILWGDYLIYEQILSQVAYQEGVSLELAKSVFPFSLYLHETTGVLDVIFYVFAIAEGAALGCWPSDLFD